MSSVKGHFGQQSALWSNKLTFNPSGGLTGFDGNETKLSTYWNTPFSEICLGMIKGQKSNFIVIRKDADSLYSLIADGVYRPTTLRRSKWISLMKGFINLQSRCNREGFNVFCAGGYVRIGIFGNNENDCRSCDTQMGFGLSRRHSCGDVSTGTMGYIFVK